MKAEDRYLRLVRWSDEDALSVGLCPDLFPWDGVCRCHSGVREVFALARALALEQEQEQEQEQGLPAPATWLMGDAVPA